LRHAPIPQRRAVAQAWVPHLIRFDVKSFVEEVGLGGELGHRKVRASDIPFVAIAGSLESNARRRRSVIPQIH